MNANSDLISEDKSSLLKELELEGCFLASQNIDTKTMSRARKYVESLWSYYGQNQSAQSQDFIARMNEGVMFGNQLWQDDFNLGLTGFRDFLSQICIEVSKSSAARVVRSYLGEDRLFFISPSCQLRKLDPDKSGDQYIGFHQDMGFMRAPFKIVNMWTPLQEVGRNCPSLELVKTRLNSILSDEEKYALRFEPGNYGCKDEIIESEFQSKIWSPILCPGDQIVFDLMTLHRTAVKKCTFEVPRLSIELRLCAASQVTENFPLQEGIVIDSTSHTPIFVSHVRSYLRMPKPTTVPGTGGKLRSSLGKIKRRLISALPAKARINQEPYLKY
jgi:hypothetical protein